MSTPRGTPVKALVAVTYLAMVGMNVLANVLPLNGRRTGEVSDAYPSLFTPAGVTFSIWLNGEGASNCCEFSGGPYLESRFFGEGVGIAVRRDDSELREALNWALAKMAKDGAYAELYLKYFPVSFY